MKLKLTEPSEGTETFIKKDSLKIRYKNGE